MNEVILIVVLLGYFSVLFTISWLTSRNSTNQSFFTADRGAKWYLVAYGMIGASLSGVTFISVPGEVGNSAMSYFQVVLGYLLGYYGIVKILLPLYYEHKVLSIYTYLQHRFGNITYRTGAFFFLLSRVIGASFRLYLVASVLQLFFFDSLGVPFWITSLITLLLIWVYTLKGGIKTIVVTDTLQTTFMILSILVSIGIMVSQLDLSVMGLFDVIANHENSKIFFFDWREPSFFPKQFIGGALIALVMTGLDQDMMQKNLTCKTLEESQKNMKSMSIALIFVNLLFLSFGVLMYHYAEMTQMTLPERGDHLFPMLALERFPVWGTALFLIGIVAAAYSSADSALTALTTSFYVDILQLPLVDDQRKRYGIHFGFTVLIFVVILLFEQLSDGSVITAVLKVAGYTYGPLLGLFTFGMLRQEKIKEKYVPFVCCVAPVLTHVISMYSRELLFGYTFGYELLLVNGILTYLLLSLVTEKKPVPETEQS